MRSLWRLTFYLKRYRYSFGLAVLGMIIARGFEGLIPLFVKTGIDRIAAGQAGLADGTLTLASCQRCPAEIPHWPSSAA